MEQGLGFALEDMVVGGGRCLAFAQDAPDRPRLPPQVAEEREPGHDQHGEQHYGEHQAQYQRGDAQGGRDYPLPWAGGKMRQGLAKHRGRPDRAEEAECYNACQSENVAACPILLPCASSKKGAW